MTATRFCVHAGCVVDGRSPLPEDPSDYSPPDDRGSRGCNRLRCLRCEAWVRNRAYVAATSPVEDPVALYEADDWLALPWISEAASYRLYACRCTVYLAAQSAVMHDPDDFDPVVDATFPWRCGGHPAPTLPLVVDGEIVASGDDAVALIDRLLDGWKPAVPGIGDHPTTWLFRLYTRLRGLEAADVVSRHVAELPLGVALMFFTRFPDAAGAAGVVERLDLNAASKAHVVKPATRRLSASAPGFLAARAGRDAAARDLLRRVLLEGDKAPTPDLLEAVAEVDGEWLARHGAAVLAGRHRLVKALLDAFGLAGRWELATVAGIALVGDGGDVGAAVARWASSAAIRDRGVGIAIRTAAQ